MSFSICIDNVRDPLILKVLESNERVYTTAQMNTVLPELALPDPIHLHLFCSKMIWKSFPIYLEHSTPANDDSNPIYKHYDNSFEHGMLEIEYQARRGFNNGLTRNVTILEIRLILSFGWCLNSSLLNAIHQNKDKIVLLIEWTGHSVFAWRPQYIYTDYTNAYRSYIWRSNEHGSPLSIDDEAERISDLRQIMYTRDLSPRINAKRNYIGDHDAIHNQHSVLPIELGPLDRRRLRVRFYNMRNVGNVEITVSPRQPFALRHRRRSLCVSAADSSSDDSESPPSDGTWWVKTQLHPHLHASVRFAQPNTICEVRLEAYHYTQTLGSLSTSESLPRTV